MNLGAGRWVKDNFKKWSEDNDPKEYAKNKIK